MSAIKTPNRDDEPHQYFSIDRDDNEAASPSSSVTLIDDFEFDESMPNIIDECLATTTAAAGQYYASGGDSNDSDDALSSPFALGDFWEKEHSHIECQSKDGPVEPKSREDRRMNNIRRPRLNDVLIGRGGLSNKEHPGNLRWRRIMIRLKPDYDAARKSRKADLMRLVVDAVRGKDGRGGRFLVRDEASELWSDIGDMNAMKKTSQALRDIGKKERKVRDKEERARIEEGRAVTPDVAADIMERDSERSSDVVTYGIDEVKDKNTSDMWDIMSLFNEEIGEWIVTVSGADLQIIRILFTS